MSQALKRIDGVSKVDVSFPDHRAVVDSTRCTDEAMAEMQRALKADGYAGKVLELQPPAQQPY